MLLHVFVNIDTKKFINKYDNYLQLKHPILSNRLLLGIMVYL